MREFWPIRVISSSSPKSIFLYQRAIYSDMGRDDEFVYAVCEPHHNECDQCEFKKECYSFISKSAAPISTRTPQAAGTKI